MLYMLQLKQRAGGKQRHGTPICYYHHSLECAELSHRPIATPIRKKWRLREDDRTMGIILVNWHHDELPVKCKFFS